MDDKVAADWRQTLLPMNDQFLIQMGIFQGAWGLLELTLDFAVGRLLKLENDATHVLCSRLDFRRRVRLVTVVAKKSDLKHKAQIVGAINNIANNAKRNVFMHCTNEGTTETVTFLERTSDGDPEFIEHTYMLGEFENHVASFCKLSEDFFNALGATHSEFEAFLNALPRQKYKSKTSPMPPKSRA